MGHLVIGYPSLKESLETAQEYIQKGIKILELQIPFSHPTADGPVITKACQYAVEIQGVSTEQCLRQIETLRKQYPEQEIMVMSYFNPIFAYGPERFAQALQTLQVKHLIVPDLPVDSPMAPALKGVQLVPVLAANTSNTRLQTLLEDGFDFFYLMSDFKITGSAFSLHPRLQTLIQQIRAFGNARIGIGFGIATLEQVQLALQHADIAIVGSALIQAKQKGQLAALLQDVPLE